MKNNKNKLIIFLSIALVITIILFIIFKPEKTKIDSNKQINQSSKKETKKEINKSNNKPVTNNKNNSKDKDNDNDNDNKKDKDNDNDNSKDKKTEYYCEIGYDLTTNNKCSKTEIIDATPKYECDEGNLNNNKCIIEKELNVPCDKVNNGKCLQDYGDTDDDEDTCISKMNNNTVTEYNDNICTIYKIVEPCDDGYTFNGTVCSKTSDAKITSYICNDGYTKNNNKCEKNIIKDALTR